MKRLKYFLCGVYDTETTNIINTDGDKVEAHAFPILFIDNDIRGLDLKNYTPDEDDRVNFYRTKEEYINRLIYYMKFGREFKEIPIICAYNLMFDLQPLMNDLVKLFDISVNAQSSTNVYTLDLYEKDTDTLVMRFWDTFHLEMRGLEAMGETAGLAKAKGSWNYDLIRTNETPLTDEEYFYAKRDVQVIPAYLKYLLHANEWMKQSDLGVRVLTKTSIVRQMARRQIGNRKITKTDGKEITIDKMFTELCKKELPQSYSQYGIRKACFRGGFTFTAAKFASTIQRRVYSVDVTSMHHTFINGRMCPDNFGILTSAGLRTYVTSILNTPKEYVMNNYGKPFTHALHAKLNFYNIRLKKGTCFEDWGIGLIPMAKFRPEYFSENDMLQNAGNDAAENMVRSKGWHDTFSNAVFAFGKLYRAEKITIHVNELELWAISRVYEWDKIGLVCGEGTCSFIAPPDFVTLQSNLLFEMKSACKFISNHYHKGTPYLYNIPQIIPDGIRDSLLDGTCEEQFFEEYYTGTVKGMFNGIYGTMAQDIYKPSFTVDALGNLLVDKSTLLTEENWDEKQPKTCRVLYTYGMRIVGGSRLHMILAIEEMYNKFGNRIRVLGGDTDSMKISCDSDVTEKELEESLDIFKKCSKQAIDYCMQRVRKNFPDMASPLTGIGGFELENKGAPYEIHLECWNKARVSYTNGKAHITCAGLSRPIGKFHIERFIENLVNNGNKPEDVLSYCLGYNVDVAEELSFSLMGHRPNAADKYIKEITDYLGNKKEVITSESVALYPSNRLIGDTTKFVNASGVKYIQDVYHREINLNNKKLCIVNNIPMILESVSFGYKPVMIGSAIENEC